MRWPATIDHWLGALPGASRLRLGGPEGAAARTARTLFREGRFAEAERAFEALAPGATRSLALGHLALLRDDLARAEEQLAEARAADRWNREVQRLLAEVHCRRGDFTRAAALLEATGRRSAARKLRAFGSERPYAIDGPGRTRLPFVTGDPLPIVKARVNGSEEALFLIDTGAPELMLDSGFADAVGAARFGREGSYFGGGNRAAFGHGAVGAVELGELVVRRLPALVMSLAPVRAALGQPALAGILGTGLFYRLRATIDYPGAQLLLARRETPPDARGPRSIDVPIRLAGDHFIVAEGRLDDELPLVVVVDTGVAGGAFAASSTTLEAAGTVVANGAGETGFGGAGRVAVKSFGVASFALGNARREGLAGLAGVFPPQLEWDLGFRVGGFVAHDFLLPFAATFDFARMALRLEPGRSGPGGAVLSG